MVRRTRTIKSDASRKIDKNMNKVWNDRLSEMRVKRGISKSELAAGADVTPATVTGWENSSIKTIKSENLLKACLYLNVSPYWVMFGITGTNKFVRQTINQEKEEALDFGN